MVFTRLLAVILFLFEIKKLKTFINFKLNLSLEPWLLRFSKKVGKCFQLKGQDSPLHILQVRYREHADQLHHCAQHLTSPTLRTGFLRFLPSSKKYCSTWARLWRLYNSLFSHTVQLVNTLAPLLPAAELSMLNFVLTLPAPLWTV